tara:strand:+ start:12391 stop:12873 length:483 start_codon:yes stop_codon:yes gene_type:complete
MARKLQTAYFINNERTLIEAVYKDGKDTYTIATQAVGGDHEYEQILEQMDLDSIHEATFKKIKDDRQNFEDMVKVIAVRDGLLETADNFGRQEFLDQILLDDAEKEDEEELFKTKLGVFEKDIVKNSSDRKLKAELRKADTLYKIIEVLIKFKKKAAKTT